MRIKDCEKEEGNFKHPVQFYLSRLRVKNRLKNSKFDSKQKIQKVVKDVK